MTLRGCGQVAQTPRVISDEHLHDMAHALVGVGGVEAVVLGGSRARGTHHQGSDVDLGLYYDHEHLDLSALSQVTERFSDTGAVQISAPGGWGPWVDGGGWLTVDGTAVDWILREITRVREQCERAVDGNYAFHAQPGHPLGFLDVSYAGEVATCRPLADPSGYVKELRALVQPYPPALRQAVVGNVWQAGFLVDAARKGTPKQDIGYVMLCCSTALMLCAHAWHATAGSWPTNEKGLVVDVARLDLDTHDFAARAAQSLVVAGTTQEALELLVDGVKEVVNDTVTRLRKQS